MEKNLTATPRLKKDLATSYHNKMEKKTVPVAILGEGDFLSHTDAMPQDVMQGALACCTLSSAHSPFSVLPPTALSTL